MSEYINSHQNPDALRCEWQRAAVDGTLSTLKQLIHHSAHSHTTAVTERRWMQRHFLSAETIALLKCADFALPFPFHTSLSDSYLTGCYGNSNQRFVTTFIKSLFGLFSPLHTFVLYAHTVTITTPTSPS